MAVMGLGLLQALGVSQNELIPCSMRIATADKSGLRVMGAIFITLTTRSGRNTKQMAYVVKQVQHLFIPYDGLRDLGLVGHKFEAGLGAVQKLKPIGRTPTGIEANPEGRTPTGIRASPDEPRAECGCPRRTPLPSLPTERPFPAEEKYIGDLKN
jgi:hypothetical protein